MTKRDPRAGALRVIDDVLTAWERDAHRLYPCDPCLLGEHADCTGPAEAFLCPCDAADHPDLTATPNACNTPKEEPNAG